MKNCKECHKQYSQMNKNAEGGCTPPVLQINNPSEVTLFHKVVVPTSMGDDTAFPPEVGLYKNVLLYYEVNQKSYLYSSDGIPTLLVNGVTDYEQAINLPQINGVTLLGNKTATQLGLQDKLTAGDNISIDENNVISATDTTYTAGNGIEIDAQNNNEISVKIGDGLELSQDGDIDVSDPAPIDFFDGAATDSGCGTSINLNNMIREQPVLVEIKGNTVQSSTPTPDSPVSIQTVAGAQTIAINDTNYLVDLGSLELCKIGNYRDRIYNDGKNWMLYKAVEKVVLDGTETYLDRSNTSTTHYKCRITNNVLAKNIAGTTTLLCTHFVANSGANNQSYSGDAICGSTASDYQRQLWFSIKNTIANSAAQFQTWVTNNTPAIYYAVAEPSTAVITDKTLIGQLNAIMLASGANSITISSIGLTGELCIEGYSDNWNGNMARVDAAIKTIPNEHVSVEQFGVYGDGVHDDTVALQNAITYCTGRTLLLGDRVFSISAPLSANNVTIEGNNASIFSASNFSGSAMLIPHNKVAIDGIKFDCNNYVICALGDSSDCTEITINNCDFTGTKANYRDDDRFALNYCVYLTAQKVNMTNTKVHDNLSHGARLYAKQAHTIVNIDNCEFNRNGIRRYVPGGTENPDTYIVALGLAQYNMTNGTLYDKVTITNCYANENGNTGIAPHSCHNLVIDSCVCNDNGEHGICVMDGKDCVISNNICKNNYRYGVRIQGDYTSTAELAGYKNAVVTGNYIEGNGFDTDYHIENVKVSNNLFVYKDTGITGTNAIIIGRTTRQDDVIKNLIITNNQFKGYSNAISPISCGILLDNTNTIGDNYVDGKLSNGYYHASTYMIHNTCSSLKYGTTDNIITNPTDFSQWTTVASATISNNVITRGTDDFIAYTRANISPCPRFISVLAKFSGYTAGANFAVGVRFRDSNNTLVSGDYYLKPFNQSTANGYHGAIFDLSKVTGLTPASVAKVDVMLRLSAGSVKMEYCYCAVSEELPILPNTL